MQFLQILDSLHGNLGMNQGNEISFITLQCNHAELAESGSDPPTSGLWAQHVSSLPLCIYGIVVSMGANPSSDDEIS